MKKERLTCEFCEELLVNGGFRIINKNKANERLDICGDCLSEVLSDYADVTGKTALVVETSGADFAVLRGEGAPGEDVEAAHGSGFASA